MINLLHTLVSIGKMAFKTGFSLNKFRSEEDSLIVIGNGPSAKVFIEKATNQPPPCAFMAVNLFASTPAFQLLKPAYYHLMDHAFLDFSEHAFYHPEQLQRLKIQPDFLATHKNIVATWNALCSEDWPFTLFIPYIYRNEFIVKKAIEKSIKIIFYNYVVVKGYEGFENWIYSRGWGSMQSQNIINACIFQAINSGFKKIYLTGVDNNFHLNMQVNENNELMHVDQHFYEVEKKITPQLHADGTPVKMHEFFLSLHKAFYAHHRLAKYAKFKNVAIYNATPGSFIDAYERKEIPFD